MRLHAEECAEGFQDVIAAFNVEVAPAVDRGKHAKALLAGGSPRHARAPCAGASLASAEAEARQRVEVMPAISPACVKAGLIKSLRAEL